MIQVRCSYCHKLICEVSEDSSGAIAIQCTRGRCKRAVLVELPTNVSTYGSLAELAETVARGVSDKSQLRQATR